MPLRQPRTLSRLLTQAAHLYEISSVFGKAVGLDYLNFKRWWMVLSGHALSIIFQIKFCDLGWGKGQNNPIRTNNHIPEIILLILLFYAFSFVSLKKNEICLTFECQEAAYLFSAWRTLGPKEIVVKWIKEAMACLFKHRPSTVTFC